MHLLLVHLTESVLLWLLLLLRQVQNRVQRYQTGTVDKGIAAYKAEGIEAKGYVCDVTNEEQVNAMVAQIEKEVGVIDILVNNAGIIKRIPMHEMSALNSVR